MPYFELIDASNMQVHIDYEFITAGELGNQLIRIQSSARSLANISGKRWVNDLQGEPHLVVKSFNTEHSAEYRLALASISATISQPLWADFAKLLWGRLISTIYFGIKGELPGQESINNLGASAQVTLDSGSEEDLRLFLKPDSLTKEEAQKVKSLLGSLIDPANKVSLKHEETQITIVRTKKRRRPR